MKVFCSVNPLYLIIGEINGYIEENNEKILNVCFYR